MKRFLMLCLAVLLCFHFSGCLFDEYSSSERSKLIKEGEKVFKEYLAKKHPDAKITEMKEIAYLGKNNQFQLTEFAEGKWKTGNEEFLFAVNTKTGDIYTSEKTKEFKEKIAGHVNSLLDLQWTAVKADVYPNTLLPLKPLNPDKPPRDDHPITLRGMLPAAIPDMDAYVKTALGNPSLQLSLRFLFTGKPLQPEAAATHAATGFSDRVSIELQRYPDSLKPVIENVSQIPDRINPKWPRNGYACLAEETLIINGPDSTYQKWADYHFNGSVPMTVHYPAYTQRSAKTKDTSIKKEEKFVTAGKDLQITEKDSGFEFLTANNQELKFYVFINDLASVENIKEIAERNRKFHDAAFNESRWHPVLDRWTVGIKDESRNQIYSMQQKDLIIVGKAALEKLPSKKKNT